MACRERLSESSLTYLSLPVILTLHLGHGPASLRLPVRPPNDQENPKRIHLQHSPKTIRHGLVQRARPRMAPPHRLDGRLPLMVQEQRDWAR